MIGSVRVLESRFVQSCTSIANAPQISNAEIAILGRSNVGKSSLINALLNNKNLAKSSSTPGKTKLVNLFVSRWEINSHQKNSSLGMQFRTCENFCGTTDHQSSFIHKNSHKYKSHTANTRICDLDSSDSSELNESSLRGNAEAIQKNQSCDSTNRISPDSWCKKSESKGAVVPPADFLLESDKRGSPPKSEKRQLLARRGSGVGGAALLRKEKGESSAKSVDCFGDESPRNDDSAHDSHKSPQNEFAQKAEFVIHILDFPGFGYAKVSKSERDSWDKNLSTFLKKRESIKLFIHLIDSRHTNLALDNEIRAFLRSIVRADADILEVFTKADKLKKSEIHALKGRILVSTTKKDLGQGDLKDNIESLRHAILRTMYHI